MNKVILMGRLTANPDYRQTPQGSPVCRFTIAVSRNYVSKNSGQREADFIDIEAWNTQADFVSRYFSKGKPIIVEGSLKNNNYTDQNGIKHYTMRVQASAVYFALTDNSNGGYGNYNNGNYQQGGYANNMGYQGGYGNGGYNQNNYGNDNYYQSQQNMPPQAPVYQQPNNSNQNSVVPNTQPSNNDAPMSDSSVQLGNLDDFEEILSDGEIPF